MQYRKSSKILAISYNISSKKNGHSMKNLKVNENHKKFWQLYTVWKIFKNSGNLLQCRKSSIFKNSGNKLLHGRSLKIPATRSSIENLQNFWQLGLLWKIFKNSGNQVQYAKSSKILAIRSGMQNLQKFWQSGLVWKIFNKNSGN